MYASTSTNTNPSTASTPNQTNHTNQPNFGHNAAHHHHPYVPPQQHAPLGGFTGGFHAGFNSGFNGGNSGAGNGKGTRRGGKWTNKSSGTERHVQNLASSVDNFRELIEAQATTINKLIDRQDRAERFFDTALHDQWQFFCSQSLSISQMSAEQQDLVWADKLKKAKEDWLKEMRMQMAASAGKPLGHLGQGDQAGQEKEKEKQRTEGGESDAED